MQMNVAFVLKSLKTVGDALTCEGFLHKGACVTKGHTNRHAALQIAGVQTWSKPAPAAAKCKGVPPSKAAITRSLLC